MRESGNEKARRRKSTATKERGRQGEHRDEKENGRREMENTGTTRSHPPPASSSYLSTIALAKVGIGKRKEGWGEKNREEQNDKRGDERRRARCTPHQGSSSRPVSSDLSIIDSVKMEPFGEDRKARNQADEITNTKTTGREDNERATMQNFSTYIA